MSINTDSKKLVNRIKANKKYQKFDITKWILTQVRLHDGEKLLDIGCGTGEQLLKFGQENPHSEIIGIDASEKSLSIINAQCKNLNLKNVKTILGNMDELSCLIDSSDFDVITSCFALYYSKNIPSLISTIKNKMKNGGRLFVCGPVEGNNKELIDFQKTISSNVPTVTYHMTETILPEIKKSFTHVSSNIFENPIKFLEEQTLFKYWTSYYLYDQKLETTFKEKLQEHFIKNNSFTVTKKTIGINANLKGN